MLSFLPVILLLPFLLEACTRIGFVRPNARRHPLFYVFTPVLSLLVYISLAVLFWHPIIAFAAWLLVYVGLTVISNVKNKVLGEPLNGPDLETARHLFIYPEFYVAYVGEARVVLVFGLFTAGVVTSLALETSFSQHLPFLPDNLAWAITLVAWCGILWMLAKLLARVFTQARARKLGFLFDTNTDAVRFGLFPLMPLYGLMLMDRAENPALRKKHASLKAPASAPDLIAIQAESYFDLDRLYQRIDGFEGHKWQQLEALRTAGAATGTIEVPAWGASTMQSEFAFLSGVPNDALGIDCINPYQRAAHTGLETLATRLKAAGYRTICIHPAKKEFFRRETVIPKMGFDDFIGIEAFESAPRFGLYVSDEALADVIEETMATHRQASDAPLFLFVITIESHGPWKPGRLADWIDEAAATETDPTRDPSFALYRQHMDNVTEMFERLGPEAPKESLTRPRTMAMYGDHLPAYHELFERHGLDGKAVDYVLWHSDKRLEQEDGLRIEDFADRFLKIAGF